MLMIVGDGERSASEYDAMAPWYAAANEVDAFNAHYERPAMISLLGRINGRRILEIGCGSGPLTEWLVDNGAEVTAMDVSPEMVGLARQRLRDRAVLHVADATEPLAFARDASFDLAVASLVLHYIEDWVPVLREFRRVLQPDGVVVFSTHHPTRDWEHTPEDYFAVRQVSETWSKQDRDFEVTFWRRPLTAMTEAIASAGFVIEHLVEPAPSAELRQRDPASYEMLATSPRFLFFRLAIRR